MGKRKKEDDTFLRKKTEENQSSVTIIISVGRKRIVFPVRFHLQGK